MQTNFLCETIIPYQVTCNVLKLEILINIENTFQSQLYFGTKKKTFYHKYFPEIKQHTILIGERQVI